MRRLPALIASLGLILIFASNLYADDKGIYVGGIAGAVYRADTVLTSPSLGTEKTEFDPGYTFGGSVGYNFGNNFRLESELSYRENELRTGGGKDPQASTSSLMVNGFYDIPINHLLYLYFGAGLGVATAQLETVSFGRAIDANESLFAYQLEAGVSYNIRPHIHFSVGYRFFDAADPEFVLPAGQRVRMELDTHELVLKMRYQFDL